MQWKYKSESEDVFAAIERAANEADNIISLSDGRLVIRVADGEEVRIDVDEKRWIIPPKPGRKKAEKGQINRTAYKRMIDEIVVAYEARRMEKRNRGTES